MTEYLKSSQVDLALQTEDLCNTPKMLEEMHARYFSLYRDAPIGYVVLDEAARIKQANDYFMNMLNVTHSQLQGRAFADLLPDADARMFRAHFKSFFRNPAGKQMDVCFSRADDNHCYARLGAVVRSETLSKQHSGNDELLLTVTDITDRKRTETILEAALAETRAREAEIAALLTGARAVLQHQDFQTTARKIFDSCCSLIGATSGYVALLSDDGAENEVLFLESGNLPCSVSPELPMPIRGLREEAYIYGKAVYHNDFMNSHWVNLMPAGHVVLNNVMFAPLVLDGKTVGIIGLANKAADFDDNDAKIASGFGEMAAIALQNSRNMDDRIKAERQREQVIADLKTALDDVKKLSGLLPICSHCKKIRDDQGYWKQIENYIQDHSDAQFSHSICRECAYKYYPEFDLYDEN